MARMNVYTDTMDQIEPPAYLKDRVLAEVREITSEASAAPSRQAATQKKGSAEVLQPRRPRFAWATVGATAAVLTLVAIAFANGVFAVPGSSQPSEETPVAGAPFSLVAYAAEPGIQFASSEGLVFFGIQGFGASGDMGMYTGCLFSIEGDGIVQIDIALSKGQIYAYAEQDYTCSDPDAILIEGTAAYQAVAQKLGGFYEPRSEEEVSQDKVTFTVSACRLLGATPTVSVVPQDGGFDLTEVKFGFWIAPEDQAPKNLFDQDIREGWHRSLDALDGETLRITIQYADGSQVEQSYVLKAGKMKVTPRSEEELQIWSTFESDIEPGIRRIRLPDSVFTVLPELASDDEPYVYALYGMEVAS